MRYTSLSSVASILFAATLVIACGSSNTSPGSSPTTDDASTGGDDVYMSPYTDDSSSPTDDSSSSQDTGSGSDAPTACNAACMTNLDCVNACPPVNMGANCCDSATGHCYQAASMCPTTTPKDSGPDSMY